MEREGSTKAQCPSEDPVKTECSKLKIGEEMLTSGQKFCCRFGSHTEKCEGRAVRCGRFNCRLPPTKQYCVQDKQGEAKCMDGGSEVKICSKLQRGQSVQIGDGGSMKLCCRPVLLENPDAMTQCSLMCGESTCSSEATWKHGYCQMLKASNDAEPAMVCPTGDKTIDQCKKLPIGETLAITTIKEPGLPSLGWCCKPSTVHEPCNKELIQCGGNQQCNSKNCLHVKGQEAAKCPSNKDDCDILVMGDKIEKRLNKNSWCCASRFSHAKLNEQGKVVTFCPQTAVQCVESFCSSTYCIRHRNKDHTCGDTDDNSQSCAKLGPGQLKIFNDSNSDGTKVCCVPNADGECIGKAYKCGNDFCTNTREKQYCLQNVGQEIAGCNSEKKTIHLCEQLNEGETRQFEDGRWCCRPRFKAGPTSCDKRALLCGNDSCPYDQIRTHRYCEADLETGHGNGTRCPKEKWNKNCKYLKQGDHIALTIPRRNMKVVEGYSSGDIAPYVKHWCCKPKGYAGNCRRNLIQCGEDHQCKATSCIAEGDGQTRCPTENEQVNGTCFGTDYASITAVEKRIGLKKWCCQPTADLIPLPRKYSPKEATTATSCPKKAAICGSEACTSTYCIQNHRGIYCDEEKEHPLCGTLPEGNESRITQELWCCRPGPENQPVETCEKTSIYCGTHCNQTFCIGQGPPWEPQLTMMPTVPSTPKTMGNRFTEEASKAPNLNETSSNATEETKEHDGTKNTTVDITLVDNALSKETTEATHTFAPNTKRTGSQHSQHHGAIYSNFTNQTSISPWTTNAAVENASTMCPVNITTYNATCHLVNHEKRLAADLWCCNPNAEGNWKCPRRAVQCDDTPCDRPPGQSYCLQRAGGAAQCATIDHHECSNLVLGTEKRISSTTWCCRPSEVGNMSTGCAMREDRRSQWCSNALCPKYTYCLRVGNKTSCPTNVTHLDTCNYVTGEKWVDDKKWCCRPSNEVGICPGTATPVPIGPPLSSSIRNTYSTKMIVFLLFFVIPGCIV